MSKAKFACYSRYLLTSYFFILVPCNGQGGLACCDSWGHKESDTTEKLNWTEWKGHLFWVLVLEELIGHHRTIQLQLLQHYWLRHILGLLWYWMVCLGNYLRAFRHFCDCTQVLHFRLLLTIHLNNQAPDVPAARPYATPCPTPPFILCPKSCWAPGPWLALPSSRLHCRSHSQQRVFELIVKFSSTSSSLGTNYLSLKSANFPIRVSVCTCDLEIITIW